MRTLRSLAPAVIGALVASSPLLAHHDWPVDRTRPIALAGIVTAFTWANPHVTFTLEVRQADGTVQKWVVGGSSPKYMSDGGWDKTTLKPGKDAVLRRGAQDGGRRGPIRRALSPRRCRR